MNILRTEKLYATKSSFLNDTNELDYITRVAADVIGEIERPEWRQILMRQIIDTMEEVKRHDTFVLSFSTDRDSITLWAELRPGADPPDRKQSGNLLPRARHLRHGQAAENDPPSPDGGVSGKDREDL